MKEFITDKNSDGIRLDKFMSRVMPNVKFGEICKALRKKKVRVNGKHKPGTYRLEAGDKIQIYVNDEFFISSSSDLDSYGFINAKDDLNVIYEDDNILIAKKPSGLPSQESDGSEDSLENRIRGYLYKKGEVDLNATPLFIPSLCHRIDRNTKGLVIAAKNAPALRCVNMLIKEKKIRKFYLCVTKKRPPKDFGEINGWLVKDKKLRKMIFYDKKPDDPSALYSQTLYRIISDTYPYVTEAELLTGRTHQIRAGFAHLGCPLMDDVKYGAEKSEQKDYQNLTAYKLVFDFKPFDCPLDYLSGKVFEV